MNTALELTAVGTDLGINQWDENAITECCKTSDKRIRYRMYLILRDLITASKGTGSSALLRLYSAIHKEPSVCIRLLKAQGLVAMAAKQDPVIHRFVRQQLRRLRHDKSPIIRELAFTGLDLVVTGFVEH